MPNRGDERKVWEDEQALTKTDLLKARGLWHDVKIVTIVATSFSRMGHKSEGPVEAQCTCGWVESWSTYERARAAGDKHLEEVKAK